MAADQVSQLVSLLTKTGAAHRDYIENIEKVDVDYRWPVWYAAYLLDHDLEEILGVEIDRASLAGFIAEVQAKKAGKNITPKNCCSNYRSG